MGSDSFVEAIEAIAIKGCSLKIYEYQCAGFIDKLAPLVVSNAIAGSLNPEFFCSQTVSMCEDDSIVPLPPTDYIDRLMTDKPDITANNDYIDNLYSSI